MGVKCCLCGSWTSVFQFPRRERMKERWLAACNLPEVPFRSGVCIRHFLPDDIQTALPSQRSSHVKFNAVPTLMPQPPQAQLSTVAGKRTPLVKQPPMETDISSVDNQSCLEPVASSSTAAAGQASGMKKIGSQSPCQTWSPGAQKSNPDSKTRAKSLSSGRSKRSIRLPTKVYRELQEVCISLGTTRPGAIGTLCKRYLAEGRHDTIFESSSDVDQADPERGSPGSAQSDERFDSLADSEAAYDSDVSKGELEDSDVSGTGDNTVLETDHFVGSAPSWDVRSAVVSEPQLRQLLTEMPAICQHCHREVSPDVKRQGLSYDVQWTCGRCQIITRKPWHSTEKHDDEAVFDAVFAAAVTLSGCSSTSVQRLMAAANMGTLSTNALQRITNKTVHPLIGRVNGADTDTGTVTARRPRGLAATARQQEDAQSRVPRRQHDLGDIDRPAKRACSVAEDPPTADPKENAPSSVSCDVCARAGALPTPAVPEVTDMCTAGKSSSNIFISPMGRKNNCIYCMKRKSSLWRHQRSMHPDRTEVRAIFSLKRKEEREKQITLLRLRGNFEHNRLILRCGRGELIVARRPAGEHYTAASFAPCPHCLIFVLQADLKTHMHHTCLRHEATTGITVHRRSSRQRVKDSDQGSRISDDEGTL